MTTNTDPLQQLLTVGAPALERPAAAVAWPDISLTDEVARLHAALDAFRARHGFGRAIAAPQLGMPKRFIALMLDGVRSTLVNPQIRWSSQTTFEVWDDCMSVPDLEVRVRRHTSISVAFVDEHGQPHTWEQLPSGTSELLQHEIDHLDGILMLTRAIDGNSIRPRRKMSMTATGPDQSA